MTFDFTLRKWLKFMPALGLFASGASADLVAYFPLDEGTPGTTANVIDDVIDDASHGVTDGTANNSNATWVSDPTRGVVLSTVQGNRFTAGTQDLSLNAGFTWSLWVNMSAAGNADAGADVIIGSRNGTWNKVQPTGTQRWFDLGGYDVNDDAWHHLVYTGDATGAAFYVDGLQVSSDASPFNGLLAINDVMEIGGSSRFSEDSDGLLSDIAIWDERISENRIAELAAGGPVIPIPNLSLNVDTATGAIAIVGVPNNDWELTYYEVSSAGQSLDAVGWLSLADQDYEGSGPPSGQGDGWEEAGGSSAASIAEAYLLGSSTVSAGAEIALGNAYDTNTDAQDLVFRYRNALGLIYEGVVDYITSLDPADLDQDGDVDDADFGIAFAAFTGPNNGPSSNPAADLDGDGDVDDADFGIAFAAFTGPGGAVVPEPASFVLLISGLIGGLARRRPR